MNLQTTINLKQLNTISESYIADLLDNIRQKIQSDDDELFHSLHTELEHIQKFRLEIEDYACANDAHFKFHQAYEEKEKLRKDLQTSQDKIRNMEIEHNVRVAELKALKISVEKELEKTKDELKVSKSKLLNSFKRPMSSVSQVQSEKAKPTSSLIQSLTYQKPKTYDFDEDSFSIYGSNFDSIFESDFSLKRETSRRSTHEQNQETINQSDLQTPENSFNLYEKENNTSTPRKKTRFDENLHNDIDNIVKYSKKNYPNLNITQKLEELFNELVNNHEETYLLKAVNEAAETKVAIHDFTFNSTQTDSDIVENENKSVQINIKDANYVDEMVHEIEAQYAGRLSLQETEMIHRIKDYEEKIQRLNTEYEEILKEKDLFKDEINYLKNKHKSLESFLDDQIQERDRERYQLNQYEKEILDLRSKVKELTHNNEELAKINKSNSTTYNVSNQTNNLMEELAGCREKEKSLDYNKTNEIESLQATHGLSDCGENDDTCSVEGEEDKVMMKNIQNERSITPDSLSDERANGHECQSEDEIAEGVITSDSDSYHSNDNNENVDVRNNFTLRQANLLKANRFENYSKEDITSLHQQIKSLTDLNNVLYNEILKMNKDHMDLQRDFDEVQVLLDRESNRVEQLLNEKKRPETIEERDEDLFHLNEAKLSLETQLSNVQNELAFYKSRYSHNTATTTTCSTDSGLITIDNNHNNAKTKYSEDPESPQNSVSLDLVEQINQMQRSLNEIALEKHEMSRELFTTMNNLKSTKVLCDVEKNRANSLAVKANLLQVKYQEHLKESDLTRCKLEEVQQENEYLRRKLQEETLNLSKNVENSTKSIQISLNDLNQSSGDLSADHKLSLLQSAISSFQVKSKSFEEAYKSMNLVITELMLSTISQQLANDQASPTEITKDQQLEDKLACVQCRKDVSTTTDSINNSGLSLREENYVQTIVRLQKLTSFNKALIYQRSFLLWQIGNFLEDERTILYRISRHTNPRTKVNKFRIYSFIIISIQRMKILQRRWTKFTPQSISRSSLNFPNKINSSDSNLLQTPTTSTSLITKPNASPTKQMAQLKSAQRRQSERLFLPNNSIDNKKQSPNNRPKTMTYSSRLMNQTTSSSAKVTTPPKLNKSHALNRLSENTNTRNISLNNHSASFNSTVGNS